MLNNIVKLIKATIIDLIVALLVTAILYTALELFLGQEISMVFGIANTISIDTTNKNNKQTEYDKTKNKLKVYPEYGTQYATIEISKINVDLPVYYGDTLEVLKKGVGHSSGSYFPGEGGSIVYMGHNSKNVFRRFGELQIGDTINIKTNYGEFKYLINDMQIVDETDTEKLPIQKNEETLMIYTCYPFNNIGYATQRYVVYAKLEK
ncbi:MAG: class D sortase [Clostridia bacterium]|nr:class D sortase [Clostridia bacterium]